MASSVWNKSCIDVRLNMHPVTQIASICLTFTVLVWLILPHCSKIHTIQFLEKRQAVIQITLSMCAPFCSSLYIRHLTILSSVWLTPHQHMVLNFSEQKQNRSHTGRISPGFTSCGLVGPANRQQALLVNHARRSQVLHAAIDF